ncbi:MAG: nucleotidyltransferase substrate binding protein [Chitinophagales bacterium]
MENKDIRWQQRFADYLKVLAQLEKFVKKGAGLNEMEEQGLIKSFEYTYELAWNTIKDFYESQGETAIQGSRDAIQLAFKRGLINDGGRWMEMLKDRNRTSHTYNEKTADEIVENILTKYFGRFIELRTELENIINKK